jgi:hypothetical protein
VADKPRGCIAATRVGFAALEGPATGPAEAAVQSGLPCFEICEAGAGAGHEAGGADVEPGALLGAPLATGDRCVDSHGLPARAGPRVRRPDSPGTQNAPQSAHVARGEARLHRAQVGWTLSTHRCRSRQVTKLTNTAQSSLTC